MPELWSRSSSYQEPLWLSLTTTYISLVANEGYFPFNQNVWFEFSATSSSKWNSIFQNFLKRGQPREVYRNFRKCFSQKFSFRIQLCSRKFLKFSVEWFAFRKLFNCQNFCKHFREISVPFATVFKFSKVLVE